MKKIAIFSTRNVSSAYSCLLYLKEILESKYHVHLWAFTKKCDVPEQYRNNFHSFIEKWYGKVPRLRVYVAKIIMLLQAREFDAIIINDLDFFRMGYLIKKLYPQKKVIHYNTEIHDVDIKYPWHTTLFYERHASYPDFIIECLDKRAEYRKNKYNINQNIYVINNTLPAKDVEKILDNEIDVSKYLHFEDQSLPVLIYAGGCNLSRGLGDIINVSSKYIGTLNFLFFCHGNMEDYARVEKLCKLHCNVKVFKAVSKDILFNVMNRCSIGIQYYDPTVSINHLYASPSKFFEYIAMGLNVLSSRNIGIDSIIEDNNCGVCFEATETIENGIDRLMKKGLNSRENIQALFKEHYSYEIDSYNTILQLEKLIG